MGGPLSKRAYMYVAKTALKTSLKTEKKGCAVGVIAIRVIKDYFLDKQSKNQLDSVRVSVWGIKF